MCAKQGTVQVTSPILPKKPLPLRKSALLQPLEDFSNPAGAMDPTTAQGGLQEPQTLAHTTSHTTHTLHPPQL